MENFSFRTNTHTETEQITKNVPGPLYDRIENFGGRNLALHEYLMEVYSLIFLDYPLKFSMNHFSLLNPFTPVL